MNRKAVKMAIEDAAAGATLFEPDERPHEQDSYLGRRINRFIVKSIETDKFHKLVASLRGQPELKLFDGGWMKIGGGGGQSTGIEDLAHWLVDWTTRNKSPDGGLELIYKFISQNRLDAYYTIALSGIKTDGPLKLSGDIDLVPIADLPASASRDKCLGISSFVGDIAKPSSERPVSALITRYPIHPALVEEPPRTGQDGKELKASAERRGIMNEVCQCLTVVGPCCPVPVYEWDGIENPPDFIFLGYGIANPEHEITPKTPKRIGKLNTDHARQTVNAYLNLPQAHKDNLRIPLERLNLAMRRTKFADSAIELGIAFESLLGKDQDPEKSIGTNLRENGTLIHGGSPEARKKVSLLIRDAYKMRSIAVHEGTIPDEMKFQRGEKKKSTEDRLWAGIELCALLLRKVIGAWSVSS